MSISQRNLEVLQPLAIQPPVAVSAAVAGPAIDMLGFDGDLVVALQATAGGAGNAMKVRMESSDTTVAADFTPVTNGEFPAIGATAYCERISISKDDCKRYVRINFYEETGSITTTVCASGLSSKKYK